MDNSGRIPTLEYEARLWAAGYRCVAGLDEAGRGAWAGPVVAAAVILPAGEPALLQRLAGVRDSKQLTPARREALFSVIHACATAVGIGLVSPDEIDAGGIGAATRCAMAAAVASLAPAADCLLIDYLLLPDVALPQHALPKGDVRVLSIAAASIVAKVTRDRVMVALARQVPGYGFEQHKGYGTVQHQAALTALGPSVAHRRSFGPVRALER